MRWRVRCSHSDMLGVVVDTRNMKVCVQSIQNRHCKHSRSAERPVCLRTQGVFNKQAMIQKLLAEYSPAEAAWIWWLDIDTVVANLGLHLPLAKYEGFDLVAWGRKEHILEGRMNEGEVQASCLQSEFAFGSNIQRTGQGVLSS